MLIGLYSRVSGLRCAGSGADKFVVRKGSRKFLKHRGGRGGEKATLAMIRMSGMISVGLQLVAVVRGAGEKQGEYDGEGKREEFHGRLDHQVA